MGEPTKYTITLVPEDPRTERVLYITKDNTVQFMGGPVPAMTTMLMRVCDNNPEKFEEAMRLVKLFVEEALKQ